MHNELIQKRLDELNIEFESVKKQLLEAEQFVMSRKEYLVKLNGAYAELNTLKESLLSSELSKADEVNDKEPLQC